MAEDAHVTVPWLEGPLASVAAAHRAGRLPHALLIHDSPGAGGDVLAQRIAQVVLCERVQSTPCGQCTACHRVASGQHPDLVHVHPTEDSRQIRIEQVRELAHEIGLTSHQGGYKVGILAPADALNRHAANALLKTLEEPAPRTLLVLVATQPSRLPATIISRCQRIRIRPPSRAESIDWLRRARGSGDWERVLDVLGEAPLLAARLDPAAVARIDDDTRRTLGELSNRAADPASLAERWSRSDLELRLTCLENWITERIRRAAGVDADSVKPHAGTHLPRARPESNIRKLFELLDSVRELRMLLDTPLNRALALENILRRI